MRRDVLTNDPLVIGCERTDLRHDPRIVCVDMTTKMQQERPYGRDMVNLGHAGLVNTRLSAAINRGNENSFNQAYRRP